MLALVVVICLVALTPTSPPADAAPIEPTVSLEADTARRRLVTQTPRGPPVTGGPRGVVGVWAQVYGSVTSFSTNGISTTAGRRPVNVRLTPSVPFAGCSKSTRISWVIVVPSNVRNQTWRATGRGGPCRRHPGTSNSGTLAAGAPRSAVDADERLELPFDLDRQVQDLVGRVAGGDQPDRQRRGLTPVRAGPGWHDAAAAISGLDPRSALRTSPRRSAVGPRRLTLALTEHVGHGDERLRRGDHAGHDHAVQLGQPSSAASRRS